MSSLPRIRQAVLAARDLDALCGRLRDELGLGEPFADPGVAYFGLRNAVFALGDTFLEVVSPVRPDASAARLLERRGTDCGYMVMFQVPDLAAARDRARSLEIREVFEVSLDDMAEVHLHPADIGGAIVSLSAPAPPESWRWGGAGWPQRSVPLRVAGVCIGASDPEGMRARWRGVVGELPGVRFVEDPSGRGLIEIAIRGAGSRPPFEIGGLRLLFDV